MTKYKVARYHSMNQHINKPIFKIVSIDGNIGSGKSTILTHLKTVYQNNPNVIFLAEPVDEWNTICDKNGKTILRKFYEDQNKYAFSFQMMAYISRLALMQTKIQEITNYHQLQTDLDDKQNHCYYIFTERSLHTDREIFAKMLFDQGMIEEINYQIYQKWFDHFAYSPDIYIYISTDPNICLERISKRARDGEDTISLDYLSSCHQYHENMFAPIKMNKPSEFLMLNGNNNDNHESLAKDLCKFMFIKSKYDFE